MKRLTGKIALLAAVLPLAFSCSDKESAAGFISFSVQADELVTDQTRSNVSDYVTSLPSQGEFTIVITNSKDEEVYNGLLSAYQTNTSLPSGNYSVTATYGSATDEGFDKPFFTGTQSFAVTGGNTTSVTVNVKLGNALVKVGCTENFSNYYTDYTMTLTTGNGTTLSFPKGETRAAFIDAYTLEVSGVLTSQGGTQMTFSKSYSNGSISPATCYTLLFDASNVGGTTITISFNDSVEDVELGTIELND